MLHEVPLPLLCRRPIASFLTDFPAQAQVSVNVAGALIFFGYIAVAPVFTGLILWETSHRQPEL